MNAPGNWSSARTETEIVRDAEKIQGMNMFQAAKQLRVGYSRLVRIADKYGLHFRVGPNLVDEEQIVAAIKQHGSEHSENTLRKILGVGERRIANVAEQHGLALSRLAPTPDRAGLAYDDNGYAMKRCSRCSEVKGAEFFHENSTHVMTGLSSHCAACRNSPRNQNNGIGDTYDPS